MNGASCIKSKANTRTTEIKEKEIKTQQPTYAVLIFHLSRMTTGTDQNNFLWVDLKVSIDYIDYKDVLGIKRKF